MWMPSINIRFLLNPIIFSLVFLFGMHCAIHRRFVYVAALMSYRKITINIVFYWDRHLLKQIPIEVFFSIFSNGWPTCFCNYHIYSNLFFLSLSLNWIHVFQCIRLLKFSISNIHKSVRYRVNASPHRLISSFCLNEYKFYVSLLLVGLSLIWLVVQCVTLWRNQLHHHHHHYHHWINRFQCRFFFFWLLLLGDSIRHVDQEIYMHNKQPNNNKIKIYFNLIWSVVVIISVDEHIQHLYEKGYYFKRSGRSVFGSEIMS